MGPAQCPEVEMMLKQAILQVVLPSRWDRVLKRVRVRLSEILVVVKVMGRWNIRAVEISRMTWIETRMVILK